MITYCYCGDWLAVNYVVLLRTICFSILATTIHVNIYLATYMYIFVNQILTSFGINKTLITNTLGYVMLE